MDHLPAFLPFISDAGILPPERSIFSFLLSIAAFTHMINIFLRFEQVKADIKTREESKSQYKWVITYLTEKYFYFISFHFSFHIDFCTDWTNLVYVLVFVYLLDFFLWVIFSYLLVKQSKVSPLKISREYFRHGQYGFC